MEISANLEKLQKRLTRQMGQAIFDYNLIENKDTIMVCLSGGKDSYAMLTLLQALQKRAPVSFKLIAMNLNPKLPDFPADVLPRYLDAQNVEYKIVDQDLWSILEEKIPEGKTKCSLCSRMRRGIIYKTAKELGANKVALGHHQDDMVHTLFLNMLFGGKIKGMPPKLKSDDGEMTVIRPMAYCREADVVKFARGMNYPIIRCFSCGALEEKQRHKVREMMEEWDRKFPGRTQSVFTAMQNLVPSHLADQEWFDFKGL